ncbi:MAG: hypothetical protein LBM70_02565 [Victivallales bacterium]|jgi:hypothetical protein|nr:hypothetical protein [Victivallales bacterium]
MSERSADILESKIRETMPEILDLLLRDQNRSKPSRPRNIIWANDNYKEYGATRYAATAQIKPDLITGKNGTLIMPRALKSAEMQKQRTKTQAEVFTPIRIVKLQADAIDESYKNDDLETYIRRTWLEITCGEAPYMATRYDMGTGELIPLGKREGFVDRKLTRINAECDDLAEYQRLAELAFKASYGFEWNGDSLLLARENLLYTYADYYHAKWGKNPTIGLLKNIALILSYNVFQMDGLSCTPPLTGRKKKVQGDDGYFSGFEPEPKFVTTPGNPVRVMNWNTYKMEPFGK